MPISRAPRSGCSASASASASSPRRRCTSSARATGGLPQWLFIIANIGDLGQLRLLRLAAAAHRRPTTRWIACRARATRSATSAAVSCCCINLAWILKPHWFGLADAGVAIAAVVRQRGDLVGGLLDPDVPPRAGTAGAPQADAVRGERPARALVRAARRHDARAAALPPGVPDAARVPASTTTASARSSAWRACTARRSALPRHALIGAFVMVQFVGIPFAFAVRTRSPARIGAKRAIFLALVVYVDHQHRRLLHDGGVAVLRCWRSWWGWCRAAARRCQRSLFATHDPEAQVVGVLRLLRACSRSSPASSARRCSP